MYKVIGADGKEYGPVSTEQLKQWLVEGRANAQTRVLPEGGVEWQPLATLPDFSGEFLRQPVSPIQSVPIRKTNPLALTGMILGIVAVTLGLCCCYGFPFNVAGIVFSILGLVQIKKSPEQYSGKGMAITGLILSILSILLVIGLLIFGVAMGWDEIMREMKKL